MEVQIFKKEGLGELRAITDMENNIHFCLVDLCKILGLQTNKVKERISKDGWNLIPLTDSLGRNQNVTFVREPEFYKVCLQSRKSEAEPFVNWVVEEVLPSIRKHGAYFTPSKLEEVLTDPDLLIGLANELKKERQLRSEAEEQRALLQAQSVEKNRQIRQMQPKAEFYDEVTQSDQEYSLSKSAKIIGVGRNNLIKQLRKDGVLFRDRMEVTQKFTDRFSTRMSLQKKNGYSYPYIVANGKGLAWLKKHYSSQLTLI